MLTKKLREWLVANCGVEKDAGDDEFKKALGEALVSGKLDQDTFKQLTTDPDDERAGDLSKKLDKLADGLEKVVAAMTPPKKEVKDPEPKDGKPEPKDGKPEPKDLPKSSMTKLVARFGGTPDDPDGKDINIHVKEAAERYSDNGRSAKSYPALTIKGTPHPRAGRPMMEFGGGNRVMEDASERDTAIIGSYAKFLCQTSHVKSRSIAWSQLPQHDKELVLYAMDHHKWNGITDLASTNNGDFANIVNRKLFDIEKQTLIDDALSGGLEAAPIAFDDAIIETPLLYGELFPLVNSVPVDRGRRMEGVAVGTVTGAWGGVDATPIALFNTNAYVAAFDTTIFRWEGSVRIGLDFLSDSPIDFGAIFTRQYGERLLEDLDDVITVGNGATQPLGIMGTVGAPLVAWGGATTLGNYEAMRFTVTKQEHRPDVKASAVFCGTEVSYARAKGIPVGAADARRLGGMDYDSYSWMERPFKINGSLANNQIFYAIMARYRMYVRRGLTIRTSTEGDNLMRRNSMLMVATARYGGQMERAAAEVITTTAPV